MVMFMFSHDPSATAMEPQSKQIITVNPVLVRETNTLRQNAPNECVETKEYKIWPNLSTYLIVVLRNALTK